MLFLGALSKSDGERPLSKESTMSFFPSMQKGNLDSVKADEHGKIKKETVTLQGVSVTRVTFDVGAKWSQDLKEYAGTGSCQLPHVALVLSGKPAAPSRGADRKADAEHRTGLDKPDPDRRDRHHPRWPWTLGGGQAAWSRS